MRTPMALWITLATAGTGGIIETSLTPLTPVGCPGFGTSTSWVPIMGRSVSVFGVRGGGLAGIEGWHRGYPVSSLNTRKAG